MPDQVIWSISVLLPVTVMVIALAVTVAVEEASVRCVPFAPETFDTVAVTGLAVLKAKPAGAFKMILPVPIVPAADSVIVGPDKAVKAPPAVSAEIAAPPVATVTVTVPAAKALPPQASIMTDNQRLARPRLEGILKVINVPNLRT